MLADFQVAIQTSTLREWDAFLLRYRTSQSSSVYALALQNRALLAKEGTDDSTPVVASRSAPPFEAAENKREAVRMLQNYLRERRCFRSYVDGYYGPRTAQGLARYAAALMGVIGLSAPAWAQSNSEGSGKRYAVDFWIEECEDKASRSKHAALAYSKMGVHYCTTNNNLRAAEDRALAKCDKQVPRNMRKKAPCRIISSADEIVNEGYLRQLQQDIKMPIGLEIYDGETKQKQQVSGFMVFGESKSTEAHTLQILLENGSPLCDGTYELSKRRVSFDMRCFGKFRFKDQKAKTLGYFLSNGIYAPVFSAELTRNKSYIKISPPDPD